jgi:hypothetical protein
MKQITFPLATISLQLTMSSESMTDVWYLRPSLFRLMIAHLMTGLQCQSNSVQGSDNKLSDRHFYLTMYLFKCYLSSYKAYNSDVEQMASTEQLVAGTFGWTTTPVKDQIGNADNA